VGFEVKVMAKYIAYVNIRDAQIMTFSYTDEVRAELTSTIIGPQDKLAVLLVYEGPTRVEIVPDT
jgi:hypothetical protein